MQSRYDMSSKHGDYVEHTDKQFLEELRKTDSRFKGQHINSGLQAWDDVVIPGVIYPPAVCSRGDFISHNRKYGHHIQGGEVLAVADEFQAIQEDNGMVSIIDGEQTVRLTMDYETWERFTESAVKNRMM